MMHEMESGQMRKSHRLSQKTHIRSPAQTGIFS